MNNNPLSIESQIFRGESLQSRRKHDQKTTDDVVDWKWENTCFQTKSPGDGISYRTLLVPARPDRNLPYIMDDQFKHSHKYTYLKLPSYHVSVIPLVRPKRLKDELNDQFREAYPWLNTTVTLSKLRNLKKDLFAIAMEHKACDVSTVAMAWVYFEHLVFRKNLVHKGNRKQLAGTCLVLAYKFNEPESIEHDDARDSLKTLASLIRKLDRKDPLDFEDITAGELEVAESGRGPSGAAS